MKSFLPEHWLVMFTMAVVWVPLAAARVQISDDDHPNAQAVELECDNQRSSSRAGGLVGIAPDGLGATAKARECVTLSGKLRALSKSTMPPSGQNPVPIWQQRTAPAMRFRSSMSVLTGPHQN